MIGQRIVEVLAIPGGSGDRWPGFQIVADGSWPAVRFVTAEDFRVWSAELVSMEAIDPDRR